MHVISQKRKIFPQMLINLIQILATSNTNTINKATSVSNSTVIQLQHTEVGNILIMTYLLPKLGIKENEISKWINCKVECMYIS